MTKDQVLQFRQHFRQHLIPRWYNGIAHVIFNFSILIGLMFFYFNRVSGATWLELMVVPLTLLFGNLAVYVIHRFPLHHNLPIISDHTYKVHTKWHHHFFTDQLVIYDSPRDFYILFFPPWVIFGFAVIHGPIAYYLLSMFLSPNIVFLYLGMSTLYFFLYEVLHYISHLPKDHWVLKVPYFSLMWRHHVNHHNPKLMQQYNFNIVFPFFDYVFGTVYHPGQMEDQKAKKL